MSDAQLIARLTSLWARTVRRGDLSVEVVNVVEREDRLFVTARTYLFNGDELNDIREQEAFVGHHEDYDKDDRNVAMVEAWATVLDDVLTSMDRAVFVELMPADFFFHDLASLGNCETAPQFEKALRTKKRFGAYLSK